MDSETRSWLVGVPFTTDSDRAVPGKVSLSTEQRRELASFTGLVMASTVFFLSPVLLSSPTHIDAPPLERITPPVLVPISPITVRPGAVRGGTGAERGGAARVRIPRRAPAGAKAAPLAPVRPALAPVSYETIAGAPWRSATVSSGIVSGTTRRAATVTSDAVGGGTRRGAAPGARTGRPGGLLRALVGDGRYRVQPFPTPAAGG